jgi:cytochrome c oxidase subunit 2
MPLAVVLVLLVVGSIVFHFASPWWFTPIASNWGMIDDTIIITFWVTGTVFVAVNLFMAYAVFRYRHKKGQKARYEPENKKLEWWLTGITAIGVVAMLAPGLLVWAKFVDVPDDAMTFEAIGQQWHWSYRFPGADGELGAVEARLISLENPFGLDPDDPFSQDDILVQSSVVHLPVNQPVRALLRSKDVLHDFAVPQFRVKMDLVPGTVTYVWFEPTVKGEYELLCEELCGIAHYAMRGRIVIDETRDFEAWLAGQKTFAETQNRVAGDPELGRAHYAVCSACHGAQGEGNQLLNAPKLTGQEPWYLKSQLALYKSGARGSHKDDVLGMQMAPMAATLVNDDAVNNVIAYLQSLPDEAAPPTLQGDVERGRKLYETCAVCHGDKGQGIWSSNAPRQAGMSDWYLAAQLKNFKAGIRGEHNRDPYGKQMTLMAVALKGENAVNDVVAYINTLPVNPAQN